VIRACRPEIPQVACFDTAFHRNHPEVADRFAIPDSFYREGVRRYGFHGLSYEYVAGRLLEVDPELARGRVMVCHLASGASTCAISGGRSGDGTMGFTAVDGLPMGTRTGQLDPGVVLYLVQAKRYGAKEIERFLYHKGGLSFLYHKGGLSFLYHKGGLSFLYHKGGLKGLSGVSNDMRDLLGSDARGPGSRSNTLSIGKSERRARSRQPWAASTASSSPPASASAAPRSAPGCASGWTG
jgi:acetate kinase